MVLPTQLQPQPPSFVLGEHQTTERRPWVRCREQLGLKLFCWFALAFQEVHTAGWCTGEPAAGEGIVRSHRFSEHKAHTWECRTWGRGPCPRGLKSLCKTHQREGGCTGVWKRSGMRGSGNLHRCASTTKNILTDNAQLYNICNPRTYITHTQK